ncbi:MULTISPECIES: EF-hand domain-containing protein [unclassified Streptomyces]|uniref:EF-hand domain-containing protein n=1 Tax=unclassified Streptomyces TaxID=2593676 RepID=UPI0033B145E2
MVATVIDNKAKKIFNNFDIDHDGAITKEDFDQMAHRLAATLNIQPSSPQFRNMLESYAQVWAHLQAEADSNGDGAVTEEEYTAAFATPDFVRVLDHASEAEFNAADSDRDGALSVDELRRMLAAFGVPSPEIDNALRVLDADGDGRVSRQEYVRAWHQYYTDPNADAPINKALGRI